MAGGKILPQAGHVTSWRQRVAVDAGVRGPHTSSGQRGAAGAGGVLGAGAGRTLKEVTLASPALVKPTVSVPGWGSTRPSKEPEPDPALYPAERVRATASVCNVLHGGGRRAVQGGVRAHGHVRVGGGGPAAAGHVDVRRGAARAAHGRAGAAQLHRVARLVARRRARGRRGQRVGQRGRGGAAGAVVLQPQRLPVERVLRRRRPGPADLRRRRRTVRHQVVVGRPWRAVRQRAQTRAGAARGAGRRGPQLAAGLGPARGRRLLVAAGGRAALAAAVGGLATGELPGDLSEDELCPAAARGRGPSARLLRGRRRGCRWRRGRRGRRRDRLQHGDGVAVLAARLEQALLQVADLAL